METLREGPTLSTEPIASSPTPIGAGEPCPGCGAPLAPDQRYCLECGERRTPMSSVLLGGPPVRAEAPSSPGSSPPPAPPAVPGGPRADGSGQRANTLTVIAGVGVLLLAMGVGVLIGRAGSSKSSPASPQVITLAPTSGTSTTAAPTEAAFSDDWPAGSSGYTVQLQKLPQVGSAVSAVESAKAAASAKGAKAVGALKSEDFSSLTAGSYVIYSGDYSKRAEAQSALVGLKKSFPAAVVIHVANGSGSGSSTEGTSPSSSPGGVGQSENHPAPPSVLESLKTGKGKGKSYEEKSKNLPNVVETG
jgi:hypothetical protein